MRKALPLLEQAEDHAGLVARLGCAHLWGSRTGAATSRTTRTRRSRRSATPGWPASVRSDLFRLDTRACLSGRGRRTRRSARSTRSFPRHPHPSLLLTRAWLLTMLARFDGGIADRRARPGERWRELTGDDMVDYLPRPHRGDSRRPREGGRAPAPDLRSARRRAASAAILSDLRADARPLALHARPLRRGRAARPARPHARRDGQDLYAQTLWRQVQALVDASRGEHVEAEALAREAVAIMEPTDALNIQGDALCDLAEVLQAAGRSNDADATLAARRSNATNARTTSP